MKLIRSLGRVDSQKLGITSVAAFFLISVALLAVSRPYTAFLPTWTKSVTREERSMCDPGSSLRQKNGDLRDMKNSSTTVSTLNQFQKDESKSKQSAASPTRNQNHGLLRRSVACDFKDQKLDVCELQGDIGIHGTSATIFFPAFSETTSNHSWRIKPHPRKGDDFNLTEVSITVLTNTSSHQSPPPCTIHHTVPGIVFSTGGFMGNAFHDFTDLLIPLFITSRKYDGEVQFHVSENHPNWNVKYAPILNQLSRYDIIDFNKDPRVHCYDQVTVGLRSHKDMSIDPARSLYTMVDFGRLARTSFNLTRDTVTLFGAGHQEKKPRLLIIARKVTRSFKNVDEIVALAEGLGFEAVVGEPERGADGLARFAQLVNSCDAMMGVHGAGLTNLVFLPSNAVVVQVVPLGKLERMAHRVFGEPSLDMGLKYLEYSIGEAESTLAELYPRGHPVLADPESINRKGWLAVAAEYLTKQHVRLDVARFRGTLLQALELLKV